MILIKFICSLAAAIDVVCITTTLVSSGKDVIHVKCICVSRDKGDRTLTGFPSFVSTTR